MGGYSASEMMAVAAARQVRDGQVVFVGIGLPFPAAILAKRTHAPRAVLLCESGVLDGDPARMVARPKPPSRQATLRRRDGFRTNLTRTPNRASMSMSASVLKSSILPRSRSLTRG